MNMNFNKVLVDAGLRNITCYSTEEANDVIRKECARVLGIDENEKNPSVVRRAMRKHRADYYSLIEVAIETLVVDGWGDNPFFRRFVDERNIDVGDKNIFYVKDDSILTVSKVSGDHHDLIRQKLGMGKSFSVDVSTYAVKVYDEFIRFQTGRIDWAHLIDKLYEAVDNKVNEVLYDSFLGLKKFVDPDLKVSGSVTADAVLTAADKIQSYTGQEVMFVGSRAAISKLIALVPSGWQSEKMKDERNTTGTLGYFEGVETMVIPQVYKKKDPKHAPLYDNNTILILPKTDDKPIKLVWEGDSMFNENLTSTNNMDSTVEAEYQFKMGVTTIVGTAIGQIEFAS